MLDGSRLHLVQLAERWPGGGWRAARRNCSWPNHPVFSQYRSGRRRPLPAPSPQTEISRGMNKCSMHGCMCLTACIFLLETCCNEALLLGPGSVRLCCVWQWRGRFSRFWRPLHPGAGIPCWPWLGHRKGKNMHVHTWTGLTHRNLRLCAPSLPLAPVQ